MNKDKPLLTEREVDFLLADYSKLAMQGTLHLFAAGLVLFGFIDYFDGHLFSGLLFSFCVLLLTFCIFVLSVDWDRGF